MTKIYETEKQYFSQGFWNTSNLKNMYLTFNDYNSIEDVENRERKYDNEGREIKDINIKFRGLIATYKIFKSCNKLKKNQNLLLL